MIHRPAADLARWLEAQARRERSAVRLEDALLANRFAAYFFFRLRLFLGRTTFAAALHAIKIALLFGAFPRDQFMAIIALSAGAAIVSDFWWGALERMRGRIRVLQRDSAMHRVPSEIGAWLRLASRLSLLGLAVSVAWAVVRLTMGGGLGPVDAYALCLLAGASIGLTVRAFHSGAYALRRVYRPLPSLIAVDAVSVGTLLALWPLLGIWAFPVAEALSVVAVVAITVRYTARTYRFLGFPTLGHLIRARVATPSPAVLRASLAPGVAYALVGLESLVIIVLLASPDGAGSASLPALLAALGPAIRAGFEWARLLYFDLVRLEVPLLRGLRGRFDGAVMRLAAVMGLATWAVAGCLGVAVLGVRDALLVAALLPFFVTRSLLASAQVRTFTSGAYRRLSLTGIAGLAGFGGALVLMPTEAGRLVALSVVLGLSFVALLTLPRPADAADRVLALPDWLARLRAAPRAVVVTRLTFDARTLARGVTAEERRTEAWRRRQVGRRIGAQLSRRGGAATWFGPVELVWFEPDRSPRSGQLPRSAGSVGDPQWLARVAGGLVAGRPAVTSFATGAEAAQGALASSLGLTDARDGVSEPGAVIAEFRRRFPIGVVHLADQPPPRDLIAMASRERSEILRAALHFARELTILDEPRRWDVSALADDGRLRAIFLVDRRENPRSRRRWVETVRAWNLTSAALGTGRTSQLATSLDHAAGAPRR